MDTHVDLSRRRKTSLHIYIFVQFIGAYLFRKLMVFSFLILDFAIIVDIFAARVDMKHTHHVILPSNLSVTIAITDCSSCNLMWQIASAYQWYISHIYLVNGGIESTWRWYGGFSLKRTESSTSRLQAACMNLASDIRLSLSDLQQQDASFPWEATADTYNRPVGSHNNPCS